MAVCRGCGAKHKMNWVRIPICKQCRTGVLTVSNINYLTIATGESDEEVLDRG